MSKTLDRKELRTLQKLLQEAKPKFSPEACLFAQQLKFVNDTARYKTAVTTRRSGKSTACAVDLMRTALLKPKSVSLYITLSRINAKKLVWPMLLEYNREFNLGAKTNESDLSLHFKNGSIIYLSGAKDRTEIEKFRGLALTLCYIDEAQSFPPFIESLIDDVLTPALLDNNGTLVLIGTPGPVPVGYFYSCSNSLNWSHHAWSLFDNPFILEKSGKTPQVLLQEELDRRGVLATDPKIQREFYGKWIQDDNSLVYHYDGAKSDYASLPMLRAAEWSYVFGVDLGHDDADAIAVMAYNTSDPCAYLVEEVIKTKQGVTELAEQLQTLIKKYNPDKIVVDTGGLGKKIAEELTRRYSIPLHAAEKQRKFENIELLNDAIRTSKLKIRKDSRFAHDSMLVEWDFEAMSKDPDKLKVSNRYHSDICDAVLYAFREVYHWLFTPETPKPRVGQQEWFDQQARELEEAAEQRLRDERDASGFGFDSGWD